MPIRIYTTAPARALQDDRPFGIVAWTDDDTDRVGEAYIITPAPGSTPALNACRFPLPDTHDGSTPEHAARLRLGALWGECPAAADTPFEQLREEIPVEEFVFTQVERPAIVAVVRDLKKQSRMQELTRALAKFD